MKGSRIAWWENNIGWVAIAYLVCLIGSFFITAWLQGNIC